MDAKVLCLGVLMMGKSTGYEIRKFCEEGPLSHIHHIGFGSIYPALNKLWEDGLVSCEEKAQENRPDKKIYEITEVGKDAFKKALIKTPSPDRHKSEALFILFFAQYLSPSHVEVLLDNCARQACDFLKAMDNIEPEQDSPGRRFVRGMGIEVYKTMRRYIEENRHKLMAEIKSSSPL